MRVYHDEDADLSHLAGRRVVVIGYGNQGRSQALNLRDSGLEVLIGNRPDEYADRARQDGFDPLPLKHAAARADVLLLLIPDEVMPEVYARELAPYIRPATTHVFASGYCVAFGLLDPLPACDVILVAPRMIGAGVRELFLAGRGFPAFFGVERDLSGTASETALALCRGIGATRAGVVEVTFTQEAELDLFTEQCFGPAFGQVLTSAVDLLVSEGYPPAAVLLELYMSGELAYTMAKIAEMGLLEQGRLHSLTSQYGSLSRGMRFVLPELRERMRQGLEEIRSGQFVEEWKREHAAGYPTLNALRQMAEELPLAQWERELREALGRTASSSNGVHQTFVQPASDVGAQRRPVARPLRTLQRLFRRDPAGPTAASSRKATDEPLAVDVLREVIRSFLAEAERDHVLADFAQQRRITTHYVLSDIGLEFHLTFDHGSVHGAIGAPSTPAEVLIRTSAQTLDGMLTGRVNPMRALLSGQLSFMGDSRQALTIQIIQKDLCRIYQWARNRHIQ